MLYRVASILYCECSMEALMRHLFPVPPFPFSPKETRWSPHRLYDPGMVPRTGELSQELVIWLYATLSGVGLGQGWGASVGWLVSPLHFLRRARSRCWIQSIQIECLN